MKSEIKTKWVEALRSGQYKQGKNRLRDGDCFCCLGVLTDLYLKEKSLNWEISVTDSGHEIWKALEESSTLPAEVREWAGLKNANPLVSCQGIDEEYDQVIFWNESLAEINDFGIDFKRIAEIIETNPVIE